MTTNHWYPTGTLAEPFLPQDIGDPLMAFPGSVAHLLPPASTIPEEFTQWGGTEWNQIAEHWFGNGLDGRTEFYAKEDIKSEKAFRHLRAVLGSFEPKHEYKLAAVAYLMSLWFDEVRYWK